jgi:hypothetical protein
MIPGIPGVGISGLFYVLGAVCMPIRELWRSLAGEPGALPRWALAIRQSAIAIGIVAAMAATFWLLDVALVRHETGDLIGGAKSKAISLRVSALLITSGVLVFVLGAMHALRMCLGRS